MLQARDDTALDPAHVSLRVERSAATSSALAQLVSRKPASPRQPAPARDSPSRSAAGPLAAGGAVSREVQGGGPTGASPVPIPVIGSVARGTQRLNCSMCGSVWRPRIEQFSRWVETVH